MRVSQKEVFIADPRNSATLFCAAADGDILAENIAVAYDQLGPLATIGVILRIAADGAKRIEHIIAPVLGRPSNESVRVNNAALAELRFFTDNRVRSNFYSRSKLRARRHNGLRMNLLLAHFAGSSAFAPRSRSTILHISVASAANCPSTVALPSSLQKSPRHEITFTSSLSWSPGTTGRRNRAPSTATKYSNLLSRSGTSF